MLHTLPKQDKNVINAQEHGQCINGTCICQRGFNGRHCGLDACATNCNGHGVCENFAEDNQTPHYE